MPIVKRSSDQLLTEGLKKEQALAVLKGEAERAPLVGDTWLSQTVMAACYLGLSGNPATLTFENLLNVDSASLGGTGIVLTFGPNVPDDSAFAMVAQQFQNNVGVTSIRQYGGVLIDGEALLQLYDGGTLLTPDYATTGTWGWVVTFTLFANPFV